MSRVYKYPLEITDVQELELPVHSRPLSAQMQGDQLCLWVLVDTNDPETRKRKVLIHGTGHKVSPLIGVYSGMFIDTFQLNYGTLVFHVFMED